MSIDPEDKPPCRRGLVRLAASGFVAVGGMLAVWPLVDQMNPHPGTPLPETVDVDLSGLAPGDFVTLSWRGLPVIVRHRTAREIEVSRAVSPAALPDPLARNDALSTGAPASDDNRTLSGRPDWLVVVGICTHLGCKLNVADGAGSDTAEGLFVCPCHAARFDAAGRVRSGPARSNLLVPRYRFLTSTRMRIG